MGACRQILSGVACVAACAGAARATVLFHEDFESSPASPYTIDQQLADPSRVTDSDPANTTGVPYGAQPGQWFHYYKSTTPPRDIQVTNTIDFSYTGAPQGNNVLRLYRSEGNRSAIGAYFGERSTGVLKASWLMMVPLQWPFIEFQAAAYMTPYADNDSHNGTDFMDGQDGARGTFYTLYGAGTEPPFWLRVYENTYGTRYDQVLQGSMYQNQWQRYEMLVNLDTQKWTLTVDGITSDEYNFNVPGHTVSTLTFRNTDPSRGAIYFIDDLLIEQVNPRWKVDAGGNWSDAANWEGGVPNGTGAVAEFGSAITTAQTVTVDGPRTVGGILFDNNTASYTLAGPGTLTLDVATGAGSIDVQAGSHTIAAPLVMARSLGINLATGATLSITGGGLTATASADVLTKTGAGTLAASSIRINGLNISAGTLRITAKATANDPAGTSRFTLLQIAGPSAPTATLDLTNNSAILDYAGASPAQDIRQYLHSGGIISSSASSGRALGYGEAALLLGNGGGTFAGQTVDGTAILIKYTYGGDTNLDGQVDVIDLGNLATAWQTNGVWTNGDSNYDGFVDVIDLGLLATNWQAGVGSPLGPGSLSDALAAYGLPHASVPEPAASAASMLLAVTAILGHRRNPRSPRSGE